MKQNIDLDIAWTDSLGVDRPGPILVPNPWPLELVFTHLLGGEVAQCDAFLADLRGPSQDVISWSHDLVFVEFDQQETVRVVDAFYPETFSVELLRSEMIGLVEKWRAKIELAPHARSR